MTYVTILVCQLFNIAQRRSELGLFTRYQFSNPTVREVGRVLRGGRRTQPA